MASLHAAAIDWVFGARWSWFEYRIKNAEKKEQNEKEIQIAATKNRVSLLLGMAS
jgi:hypothetical protein